MRLVLDTNSLIQCVSRRSRYHDLWLSFIDGRNQLCVTTEILNEYVEILQRETTENFASIMLEVILNNPNTLLSTSSTNST
jgi:predicted nucleic acid-binding protein